MDASKCSQADDCSLKWFCKRFTGEDSASQSYSPMKDMSRSGKTCKNQIKAKCPYCGQTKLHKLGCDTRKIVVMENNKTCRHIKREGESCPKNNNCKYPDCLEEVKTRPDDE